MLKTDILLIFGQGRRNESKPELPVRIKSKTVFIFITSFPKDDKIND